MESLGAFAAAAQIACYGLDITLAVHQIRRQVQNAPKRLKEQADQLLLLKFVIESIMSHNYFHTSLIISHLAGIHLRITELNKVLDENFETTEQVSFLRPWLVFTSIRANQQIQESFAALAQDRSTLTLYMSSVCAVQLCAQQTPDQTMSDDQKERLGIGKELVLAQPPEDNSRSRERDSQPKSTGQSSAAQSSSLQPGNSVNASVNQKFGSFNAVGTNSKNKLGNHDGFPRGQGLGQSFDNANAEYGGNNEGGNLNWNQRDGN